MLKKSEINYIDSVLNKFKFNKSTIGYECIKKGLYIAIENPMLLYNLNNNLYKNIANELKLCKSRVRWNIERAINQMYINTDMNIIMQYFSLNENEKITPKLFFMVIIDKYNII